MVDSRDKMIDTMTVDEWNLEFAKFTEQIKKFVGEKSCQYVNNNACFTFCCSDKHNVSIQKLFYICPPF